MNEIEELYLAAIRAARRTIYVESQYLAASSLCEAMEARLAEPDGPEIVIVNPQSAQSFIEDEAMHSMRSRMIERLRDAAERRRWALRYLHPVNADGTPIYVHAKVFVVDDRFFKVGSSNVDNRSMGFDTECDIAIEAASEAERALIRNFTLSLLAEHLDCTPDTVRAAWQERDSLDGAIEALRTPEGRSLHPSSPSRSTRWSGRWRIPASSIRAIGHATASARRNASSTPASALWSPITWRSPASAPFSWPRASRPSASGPAAG